MSNSIENTLVLCDLDNLLLNAEGNLPQLHRDVLQLFASRGGKLTIYSQRSPKVVRSLLGGVRLSAPALVCGGVLAYNFAEGTGTALCRGALLLDVEAHRVTLDGQEVALTATEFRLLEDLMRHAGAVRTREQLLNAVWGYSFEGYARTVDTHVRRLRAKLGEEAAALETVRGVGYRLRG